VRRSGVKYSSIRDSYREDFLAILERIDDDLFEKREKFISYLKMSEDELQENPEFVRFLVSTTDELIDEATRLNSIVRTMANIDIKEKKNAGEFVQETAALKDRAVAILGGSGG
jgi:hypothetical protein